MDDLQIIKAGAVIAVLVLSLSVHEAAHAWVADLRGDRTARELGRLTLNPIAHIDPVWTVVIPVLMFLTAGFAFGGARPVPVDMRRLRSPLRDMSLVALAGPVSNVLIAVLLLAVYKLCVFSLGYHPKDLLPEVLKQGVAVNMLLAAFNMVPIPPLDGSRVMTWLLPSGLRGHYASLERYGMLLVVLVFFVLPGTNGLLTSMVNGLIDFAWALTGGNWA
jgi:Zn-dependent protease